MKTQFDVRDMFGRDLLPRLSAAALLLSTAKDVITTGDLMRRIRDEYREKLGGHIPSWLRNECYGEWLAVNSKRLQEIALEIDERRAARMFGALS